MLYQSEEEYTALPQSLQWRHVRYDPFARPPVDFTWEREWRVPRDVAISPEECIVLAPAFDEIEYLAQEPDIVGQEADGTPAWDKVKFWNVMSLDFFL